MQALLEDQDSPEEQPVSDHDQYSTSSLHSASDTSSPVSNFSWQTSSDNYVVFLQISKSPSSKSDVRDEDKEQDTALWSSGLTLQTI